jgi:hypothetical protein
VSPRCSNQPTRRQAAQHGVGTADACILAWINQMERGMEATWYDNLDDAPEQLIAFVIAWYIKQS